MSATVVWKSGETDRKCGDCTLCCKLLPMVARSGYEEGRAESYAAMIAMGITTAGEIATMTPDFDKADGVRCKHQRHTGCSIYAKRPFTCRAWSCRWLTGDDTAELRRPDRSHYVLDVMPDYVTILNNETGAKRQVEVVQIWVDPKHPDAWRDPALLAYLDRRGKEGKAAIIRLSSTEMFSVFPPSISHDNKWHEIRNGGIETQHTTEQVLRVTHG